MRMWLVAGAGLLAASLACSSANASAAPGQERIVGGEVADPADWPFIAELTTRTDRRNCGASVVAKDAVVTAAHCVIRARKRSLRIVTGRPDRTEESESEKFRVTNISVHRKYPHRQRHDIAVLNLDDATSAPAVLLPTKQEDAIETAPGNELRVAGWGGTAPNGGHSSDVLLDVALFAISDAECSTHFSFFQPKEEVCAFGEEVAPERYNDACYGDSGGPLVADAPRGALLVGIVSYGGLRCGVKHPGVYTQVADNLGFVKRKAGLR
jgi:trypsin